MGDLLLSCGVARVVLLVNEPNVRRKPVTWPGRCGIVSRRWLCLSLVREHVTLSRDDQEDRYGFDGLFIRDEMMNRRCYVVPFPLLKGTLGSLNGVVMVRDVLLSPSGALSVSFP